MANIGEIRIREYTIQPVSYLLTSRGGRRTRYEVSKSGRFLDWFSTLSEAKKFVARRQKERNPGPSALPSKWTLATVTRKGGKIQIRIGGRR